MKPATGAAGSAALLTARGRGAVATIAYRGDAARLDAAGLFRPANGRTIAAQPLGRVVFGHWGEEPAEEVVVCRTAVDRVELHCHGGEAAGERILGQLERSGVERIAAGAFVERFEGPFAVDIAEAFSAATTQRAAALIARQAEGPLRAALRWLSVADPDRDSAEALGVLNGLLRWRRFGLHLTVPWRVTLYGPPNVGKSSLVNALVGYGRSIVHDQPGTTRDVVTAQTAIDGWPVQLSDTAGLRYATDEVEAAGIARAYADLAAADLTIRVIDRSRPREDGRLEGLPGITVLSKADLSDRYGLVESSDVVTVSAHTGAGLRELMEAIARKLVPETPGETEAVPVTRRQIDCLAAAREFLLDGRRDEFRDAIRSIVPRTSAVD